MENTLTQGSVLLASIYAGVLMGAFYDLCYMIRHIHPSKVFDAIMDAMFWAGAFIIASRTLLAANGLQVRLFVLAGFALGFAAYKFTLGLFVIKLYHAIAKGVVSLMEKIVRRIK